MSQFFECELTVHLQTGLHARPAGLLVKMVSQFKSTVELQKNGTKKNAKSLMSLLSLGVQKGDTIQILATGEDATAAGEAIRKFLTLSEGESFH
jgi:phosphocarrier protein HPr